MGWISQIWGHIVSYFLQMCPHIWLIRPHIWLIQILSECAPIFGLFAPIFGLFANSRNSAPMFGLFSSKFAASLFWPDGTTWYRRISTYLGILAIFRIASSSGLCSGRHMYIAPSLQPTSFHCVAVFKPPEAERPRPPPPHHFAAMRRCCCSWKGGRSRSPSTLPSSLDRSVSINFRLTPNLQILQGEPDKCYWRVKKTGLLVSWVKILHQ